MKKQLNQDDVFFGKIAVGPLLPGLKIVLIFVHARETGKHIKIIVIEKIFSCLL